MDYIGFWLNIIFLVFHQLFEHSDQNISDWLEISRDLHFYKGFPKEFDPHILIFLHSFGFFSHLFWKLSFLKILNRHISESSFLHTFYIGNLIGFIRNIQQWNSWTFSFFLISLEIFRKLHFYKGFPKEIDPHILIFLNIFDFSHLFGKFSIEIFQNLHFYIRFT